MPGGRIDRIPIPPVTDGDRRTLDERLYLRAPAVMRAFLTVLLRLFPPGSRVRRRALQRVYQRGFASLGRRDRAVTLLNYTEDAFLRHPADLLMQSGTANGHADIARFLDEFQEVFAQATFVPVEVIDAGDRFAVRLVIRVEGSVSGALADQEMGQAQWLRGVLIERQHNFWSLEEALADLGLDPGIARP